MSALANLPKPLTEAQRDEVRSLLREISSNSSNRNKGSNGRNILSRKRIKKVKRISNPFESIEEGKVVNMDDLTPDCCTFVFVERIKCLLLPCFYYEIALPHDEWVKMITEYAGCLPSEEEEQVDYHVKFVVEGNAPIRYLHVYFEKSEGGSTYKLTDLMFSC